MLSTNPGCAWIRGRNWLFRAFLNSFNLAGLMVQVMRRECMFSSFVESMGLQCVGSPKGASLGSEGTVLPRSHQVKNCCVRKLCFPARRFHVRGFDFAFFLERVPRSRTA